MKKFVITILTLTLFIGVMPTSLALASSSESSGESVEEVEPFINPNPPEFNDVPAKINACMIKKVKNNWKEVSGVTALAQAMDLFMNKRWTAGAKKLVKGGAKGGVIAIGAQASVYYVTCAAKY